MIKKLLYSALVICLCAACGHSSASHEGHDHEGHAHETHHHESHSHEGHNHEGHNHEGHNHNVTSGHETAEAHGDEIILTPAKAKAAGVKVAEVVPTTFHHVIKTSGQILSAQGQESMVVAPMAGVVTFKRQLTEGMAIKKGESLLTLTASNLAEGDPIAKARVNYETARTAYERAERLVNEQIISRKAYEEAYAAYESARIAYEGLSAHQTANGQQVAAPLGGYIKNLLVNEGDYVERGQPLASVTQDRKLYLRADVSEKHYPALRTLKSANFRPTSSTETFSLADLNGRLLSFGKASGANGNYLPVTFEFDNQGQVMPGLYCEVWLISSPIEGAIAVPTTALVEEQGSLFVFIQVDEEGYMKQLVTTGAHDGRQVQIVSGLHAGQRVVVEGAYQVKLASTSNAIPAHSHEH